MASDPASPAKPDLSTTKSTTKSRMMSEVRDEIDFDIDAPGEGDELASELTLSGVVVDAGDSDELSSAQPPRQIGPYRLIKPLGRGGMGCVYLAEQVEPVKKPVAIKFASPGFAGDAQRVLARFESERRTLSLLDHPNIARILDAGTTDQALASWPYFVMEYVEGKPITRYCDAEQLSVEQRLRLFIDVCRAVQHAHFNGVVHRDLKPGNILVRRNDDPEGGRTRHEPKVIDFGIASLLRDESSRDLTMTQIGTPIGTPHYASPEQLRLLEDNAVDLRSDIYSLGVMLYELLCGRLPWTGFGGDATSAASWPTLVERMRRDELVPPSKRASELSTEAALSRGQRSAAQLAKQIRGDLDWIALRALNRLPSDRYASVGELADDLQRHLDQSPVLAGPPTALYRVRKFVRRNRVAVAAAGLVAASLVAGLAGTSYYLVKFREKAESARLSEQHAQQSELVARLSEAEAKESERIAIESRENALLRQRDAAATAQFMADMLSASDPFRDNNVNNLSDLHIALVDALDAAAQPIEIDQPQRLVSLGLRPTRPDSMERDVPKLPLKSEAELRYRLGETLLTHCRYMDAATQLERADVLYVKLAKQYPSGSTEARKLWRQALQARRGVWEAVMNLGSNFVAGFSYEVLFHAQADAMRELGPNDSVTVEIRADYAWFMLFQRRNHYDIRSVLAEEIMEPLVGKVDDLSLSTQSRIAICEAMAELTCSQRDYAAAERWARRGVEVAEESGSVNRFIVHRGQGFLMWQLRRMDRFGESIAINRTLVDEGIKQLGPNHPTTLRLELNLLRTQLESGANPLPIVSRIDEIIKVCEADPDLLFDRALVATSILMFLFDATENRAGGEAAWARLLNIDWPESRAALYRGELYYATARWHVRHDRHDLAAQFYGKAIAELEPELGRDHPRVVFIKAHRGLSLTHAGQHQQSAASFREAVESLVRLYPGGMPPGDSIAEPLSNYVANFATSVGDAAEMNSPLTIDAADLVFKPASLQLADANDSELGPLLLRQIIAGGTGPLDPATWAQTTNARRTDTDAFAPSWAAEKLADFLADHNLLEDGLAIRRSLLQWTVDRFGKDHPIALDTVVDNYELHVYARTGVSFDAHLAECSQMFDLEAMWRRCVEDRKPAAARQLVLLAKMLDQRDQTERAETTWRLALIQAESESDSASADAARAGLARVSAKLNTSAPLAN